MKTNSFAGNTPYSNKVKTLRSKALLMALLASFGLTGFFAPSVSAAPSFICKPVELRAKANQHDQKAAEYKVLRNKAKPNEKKVTYYDQKTKAHARRANAYRQRAKACEDAEA